MSKKLDMPFSVYLDDKHVSLATFWDSRFLGASKFFDSSVFHASYDLGIKQSITATLKTAFSIDDLLDIEGREVLDPLPELLMKGTSVNLKMKLCRQLAPFMLDELDRKQNEESKALDEAMDENKKLLNASNAAMLATMSFLGHLNGDVDLKVDKAQYEVLRNNVFVEPFNVSAQEWLTKLT